LCFVFESIAGLEALAARLFLSFFGFAKRLLRFHRKEFEIRKSVSAVKSMAKKVQIEFTT
jgi:transposase-like protein